MAWFDDRPPGCVAGVAGLLPSEQACADRGVEAVGADQGIPAFLRAVDEEGRNAPFVLLETRARRAQAHVLLAKLPQQEALEVGPVDGGAGGAQPLLEFVCRHIRECLPAPGEDPGGRSRGTESANFFGEAELIECPDGVRCQEQPGANLPELAGALEDGSLYASLRCAMAAVRQPMPAPTIIAFIPLALLFSCVCLRSVGRCRRVTTSSVGISGQRVDESADLLLYRIDGGDHSPVGAPCSPLRSASWWRSHRSRTSSSLAPRS